ncbi:N-acetyl-D-Glu racemase DgcA [Sphingomonas solaris]|uniref:Dipeptide epimerase n=1 Tax=Alterirhizorhabdus solaris TaxID=2529389 RepID=A0A558QS56_9SPHN|nr:N-acetyl-D-Glu racemase DgcA [Sphingomonas solaris]TVV69981.1 dipeptide epimerase [Sphingomonas solaris]
MRKVDVRIERWPVAGAFTIARGAKTVVDVVVVEITDGMHRGRGESTAIYYHGESAESVEAQVRAVAGSIEAGVDRAALLSLMPRGAARNAIDAALWDVQAKTSGIPVYRRAGLDAPAAVTTAFTLSLDTPVVMEQAARAAAPLYPLLKLKLAGEGDRDRVAAVRRGAPDARLIVDANESWTDRDVQAEAAALVPYGVELIEQPVRAGSDHLLDTVASPIPLCADESCQDRPDLAHCFGRYDAINVKLDKAGGLTEALELVAEARAAGMRVMIGCMLSTSLGVAPAFLLAQHATWIDLDGPLLLQGDREDGFDFNGGTMLPATPALWG